MNVGVYFSGNLPQTGGGYTYEQEIFDSLLSLVGESKHNFVIFSKESIKKNIPADLKKIVRNEVIPKFNIIEYFLLFFIHNFFPMSPFLRKINSKFSSLETRARYNNIDIMLFCNPDHESIDIPYITPLWDLEHRNQPWFPEVCEKGQWYAREESYISMLKRATYIITGTKAGQQEISLFYGVPQNIIKIIPFPTPNFAIDVKTTKKDDIFIKYGIKNEYLFYPAQFWPHKNHANLLYSLKIVREKHNINISVVFVGSDKCNFSYIKKLTGDLQLIEYVHFLGFIPRDDLIELYRNAVALIFPTFFGPDNLPPLEAFALQCPVIASNVSGAEEQLGDAALLFDPKNPEEIANAVVTLYKDPILRVRLIENGYARALQWNGNDYLKAIFSILDDFENVRRCWK